MKSVYIASGIENWVQVRSLQREFRQRGIDISFDWTSKRFTSPEFDEAEARTHAHDELHGVLSADHLLIVLPGGRGTHFEFGAFIANHIHRMQNAGLDLYGKGYPVTILYGGDNAARPTTFHYLTSVTRVETEEEAIAHVVESLKDTEANLSSTSSG